MCPFVLYVNMEVGQVVSMIKKCLARNDIVHEYEDGEAVVEVIDENQEYGGVFEEGI